MPPLHLLIKPASGNCNMRCNYCFYADITENREVASYGIMNLSTLENIVKKTLSAASMECTFAFQGGEPTLAGLDFYKKLIEFEQKYNTKNLTIHHAIQTNGYVIDREWAQFLAEHRFLVGLSLDGIKDTHDLYRMDAAQKGTFSKTMHAAQLFDTYGVEYNILTVVTKQLAKNIRKVYAFYKRNHFMYQQYIPCLDPIGEQRGGHDYSLTPKLYGEFLMNLFDLWYRDMMQGEKVSIRYFDNLISMLWGYPPESCSMWGQCSRQNVVESDGEVYPCDFYVLDEYKLGNLNTSSFDQINHCKEGTQFINQSHSVATECRECQWYPLCRGGCRRDRDYIENGALALNFFCESYKMFFNYAYDRLKEIALKYSK